MNSYRFEDFDSDQLTGLDFLKVLSKIPGDQNFCIRISKSGTGIHLRVPGPNRISTIHILACEGWQFWSSYKGLVWKSPFPWVTVTEALRASLLSHRDPLIALKQRYRELGVNIND